MSDDDIIASGNFLKSALTIALNEIALLTRERDEARLIHQTDTCTESAVAALQEENEQLRKQLARQQRGAKRSDIPLCPVKRIGPTNADYFGIVLETDEEFKDWGMPCEDKQDAPAAGGTDE